MNEIQKNRVERIHELHDEITKAMRTTLEKAIQLGELLAAQKAASKHGEWLPWLRENAPFSERVARDYIRFYDRREELKTASLADLTAVRRYLAEPKCEKPEPGAHQLPPAETLNSWPDMIDGIATVFHEAGESNEKIAHRLGIDVDTVAYRLSPRLPERMNTDKDLEPLFKMYRAEMERLVSFHRHQGYFRAAYWADKLDYSHLKPRLETLSSHYNKQFCDESPLRIEPDFSEDAKLIIGAACVLAITDFRSALGLDVFSDGPFFLALAEIMNEIKSGLDSSEPRN